MVFSLTFDEMEKLFYEEPDLSYSLSSEEMEKNLLRKRQIYDIQSFLRRTGKIILRRRHI